MIKFFFFLQMCYGAIELLFQLGFLRTFLLILVLRIKGLWVSMDFTIFFQKKKSFVLGVHLSWALCQLFAEGIFTDF